MERIRRLRSLWSWLPLFRVAAETQHLPTASKNLFLSASSISRAVRLLEEDLGKPLFVREGRSMRLNGDGERFLGFVRDAMRILDEGVEAVGGDSLRGLVDISAPRDLASVTVLPVACELLRQTPELVVRIHDRSEADVNNLLLSGQLDIALVQHPHPDDEIRVERLMTMTHGVYAGINHPLTRLAEVDLEVLSRAAFVLPATDTWPLEHPRRVGAQVGDLTMAADLCAETDLLAFLPDVLAQEHPRAEQLERLALDIAPSHQLYAIYRKPLTHHYRTEHVLTALRAQARLFM